MWWTSKQTCRASSRPCSVKPQLECLESRLVPTTLGGSSPLFPPPTNLVVTGTNNADVITVERVTNTLFSLRVTIADRSTGVAISQYTTGPRLIDRIWIDGLDGNDLIHNWTSLTCTMNGGNGNDNMYGGGGVDRLDGGLGDDYLYGGLGNDVLIGGFGNDYLHGQGGSDMVVETGDVDFTLTDTNLWGLGTDTLVSIETAQLTGGDHHNTLDCHAFSGRVVLYGGKGNDALIGGSGNDYIDGGDDADSVIGNAGNDYLVGGAGADILDGGMGNDTGVDTQADKDASYVLAWLQGDD